MTRIASTSSTARPGWRRLEGLRRAGEAGADGGWQHFARRRLHPLDRGAERRARLEVEREGDRGKLARVVHRSGPVPGVTLARRPSGTDTPWRPVMWSRFRRREVALVLGQQLHHHPVLVVGRVDGADLARRRRRCRARSRSGCTSMPSADARSRSIATRTCGFLIWRSLVTSVRPGNLVHPLLQRGGGLVQRLDVGALSVNWYWLFDDRAADVDHRRVLDEHAHARHRRQFLGERPAPPRRRSAGARCAA